MTRFNAYHRPATLDEALALLADSEATVLAGGTQLVAAARGSGAAIDLQALPLDFVEVRGEALHIGTLCTLRALVAHQATPLLVRDAAIREGPNTFRNVGTIGGVIALADGESELYAALLVHEAMVTYATPDGERAETLDGFITPPGALLTAVTFPVGGATAHARVARTPADAPIVAALARRTPAGETRLALCGIGERPLLLEPADVAALTPPEDFRGSTAYRREMGVILTRRVLDQLEGAQ